MITADTKKDIKAKLFDRICELLDSDKPVDIKQLSDQVKTDNKPPVAQSTRDSINNPMCGDVFVGAEGRVYAIISVEIADTPDWDMINYITIRKSKINQGGYTISALNRKAWIASYQPKSMTPVFVNPKE